MPISISVTPASASTPAYVTAIPAYITAGVAVLVLVVAYQQWRTARDKLRFDLYARRLSVYDAAMDYIEMSIKHGDGYSGDEAQVRTNFVRAWRESRFLFGKDSKVYSVLDGLQTPVNTLTTPIDRATVLYDTDAHKAALERRSESFQSIATASVQLSEAMEPFLDFKQLQNQGMELPHR